MEVVRQFIASRGIVTLPAFASKLRQFRLKANAPPEC